MRELDINLLRSFVRIARIGSISEAAQKIGRTQSAVSMQMKRLETVVDQPLFHRTAGGVELTTEGVRMLRHAERILAVHDDALTDLSGQGLRGSISFGCPEDYLTVFFPELLKGFGQLYPAVEIEIVCVPSVELHELIRRRRIDLALISQPLYSDELDVIRTERLVWVGNHAHPEILENDVLPLALSAPDTLDHIAACAAMEQARRIYRISFASNSLSGLLTVARTGQAISVMTRSAVPDDLLILTGHLPVLPEIGVRLAYAARRPNKLVQTFGDFVTDSLRQTRSESTG